MSSQGLPLCSRPALDDRKGSGVDLGSAPTTYEVIAAAIAGDQHAVIPRMRRVMTGFRILLAVMFSCLAIYTGMVISGSGWILFTVFFGDMAKMGWPGQFNLDFMMMLTLSALWVAWRHRFSPAGLGLAVAAFFGGSAFLCVYLIIVSLRARGGVAEILTGSARDSLSGSAG